MDQIKIGKFIAQMRKKQGFTQRKLAEELGISDKTVSKWECGNGMPDNALMLPLCNLLGISVNELLSGEILSNTNYGQKAEENIINLLQKTQEEKKRSKTGLVITCVSDLLLVLFLCYVIFISSGSIHSLEYFFDIPTLAVVFAIVLLVLLSTRLLNPFFGAFRIAFNGNYTPDEEEIETSLRAVKIVFIATPLAAGIASSIGFVTALSQLNNIASIGKSLALAFLSIFNALIILLLLLPLKCKLEHLLKESVKSHVTEE